VNEANLEYYIAKPWEKEDLVQTVKKQLTDYVIQKVPNPLPYMNVLQADRIADSIRKGKGLSDQ
jgi:two-component system chemotaxis response regulator CheY